MGYELISCIVAVYNGERYLGEAIDSILAQTYRPSEIIIVDDGSTDGTAAVVARYGQQVRYVWQPNSGPAAARNLGLDVMQGEFVAFLDADDLWHPEKLAQQMARFRARPELDYCVAHAQNFWVPELQGEALNLRIIDSRNRCRVISLKHFSPDDSCLQMLGGSTRLGGTCMTRSGFGAWPSEVQ